MSGYKYISSQELASKWQFLAILGTGLQGIVFKVREVKTGSVYAMKCLLDEIMIPPKIVTLQQYITNNDMVDKVLKCYILSDNCICDLEGDLEGDLEQVWIDSYIRDLDIEYDMVVVTIHKYYELRFNKVFKQVDRKTQIGLAFELIYGMSKFHENEVVHGDIHKANIMVDIVDNFRRYIVNNKEYVVRSKYRPVFIDFNLARMPDYERGPCITESRDRHDLSNIIGSLLDYNLLTIVGNGIYSVVPPSMLWNVLQ